VITSNRTSAFGAGPLLLVSTIRALALTTLIPDTHCCTVLLFHTVTLSQELNRALAAAVRACDAPAAAAAVAAGADPLQSVDGSDALSIAAAAEPVPHGQIAKAVVSHSTVLVHI
jgi:hypothetical protein